MSTLRLGMVLLSLMLTTCEISALKCWRCASDTSNSEFCGEILDLAQLSPQRRNWHFVECSPPKEQEVKYPFGGGVKMVSKCRMQILNIRGQNIYSRHCVVEAENDEPTACKVRNVLQEVKMIACETCQTDGCNENFSVKPEELKVEGDNNAAISTVQSMQVLAIGFVGVVTWLLF